MSIIQVFFKNVNINVYKGENVFIVGPNGCGKSTLLKAIVGINPSCEGEILIDGKTAGDIGELVLKDRELLSENGIVIVSATVDKTTKKILAGPEILTRGFVYVKDSGDLLKESETICLNAINENTKAVIINSPNNPSGVVYSEETIKAIAQILEKKSRELGREIFIIADEPYRELVYDADTIVPYITKYYKNTLVCYSYSKSLSLPGERIGYILVPDEVCDSKNVYACICGAGRALGYVCAPTLFQQVVAKCCGKTGDVSAYKKNRDLIYSELSALGYECV